MRILVSLKSKLIKANPMDFSELMRGDESMEGNILDSTWEELLRASASKSKGKDVNKGAGEIPKLAKEYLKMLSEVKAYHKKMEDLMIKHLKNDITKKLKGSSKEVIEEEIKAATDMVQYLNEKRIFRHITAFEEKLEKHLKEYQEPNEPFIPSAKAKSGSPKIEKKEDKDQPGPKLK